MRDRPRIRPGRSKLSCQAEITSYFRPAAIQKRPISHGSKTPYPEIFQQYTPAEAIRSTFTKTAPGKSVISPYKISTCSEFLPPYILHPRQRNRQFHHTKRPPSLKVCHLNLRNGTPFVLYPVRAHDQDRKCCIKLHRIGQSGADV